MTVTKITWRALLLKAARRLKSKGWCRGEYSRGERSCAMAAIYKASRKRRGFTNRLMLHAAQDKLEKHIRLEADNRHLGIVGWNDKRGQTAKNVIATMRKVARS